MKKMIRTVVLLLIVIGIANAESVQDSLSNRIADLKGQVEGINETVLAMQSTVDALSKIKFSGYLQTQFQVNGMDGGKNVAGGDFTANTHSRFQLRRGRLKAMYDNGLSQYVIQIDVTPAGVGIKDAYVTIKEPWLKWVSLTSGVFDRPFGFEISYSSSSREAPERSRLFQTMFPGERDLGAKIEVNPDKGLLSHFNLKLGIVNGMGPTTTNLTTYTSTSTPNHTNSSTATDSIKSVSTTTVTNSSSSVFENDNIKDLIGRIGFTAPMVDQNLEIDGGVSWYQGKVTSNSPDVYSYEKSQKMYVKKSDAANINKHFDRSYLGLDVQLYYDLPFAQNMGFSLRGEYISGKQPGTSGSSGFYNPSSKADVQALYNRNFMGYYVNYVQNLGLKNQLVVKYDAYDPNTDASGSDIGSTGSNLSTTDIAYNTLGIGLVHHWDSNVKFTLYYDIVKNETVNSAASGSLATLKDDLKDNVLTLRMQYKF